MFEDGVWAENSLAPADVANPLLILLPIVHLFRMCMYSLFICTEWWIEVWKDSQLTVSCDLSRRDVAEDEYVNLSTGLGCRSTPGV
jgi:hypothetical protein